MKGRKDYNNLKHERVWREKIMNFLCDLKSEWSSLFIKVIKITLSQSIQPIGPGTGLMYDLFQSKNVKGTANSTLNGGKSPYENLKCPSDFGNGFSNAP